MMMIGVTTQHTLVQRDRLEGKYFSGASAAFARKRAEIRGNVRHSGSARKPFAANSARVLGFPPRIPGTPRTGLGRSRS